MIRYSRRVRACAERRGAERPDDIESTENAELISYSRGYEAKRKLHQLMQPRHRLERYARRISLQTTRIAKYSFLSSSSLPPSRHSSKLLQLTHLVNLPPLPCLLFHESCPNRRHDFVELSVIVSGLSNFLHEGGRGAPVMMDGGYGSRSRGMRSERVRRE